MFERQIEKANGMISRIDKMLDAGEQCEHTLPSCDLVRNTEVEAWFRTVTNIIQKGFGEESTELEEWKAVGARNCRLVDTAMSRRDIPVWTASLNAYRDQLTLAGGFLNELEGRQEVRAAQNEYKESKMRISRPEKWFAAISGVVFLVIILIVAVLVPNPSQFQVFVFRIMLAVSAAAFASMISGFLTVKGQTTKLAIRAGNGLAVFIVIFLVNPPALLKHEDDPAAGILLQHGLPQSDHPVVDLSKPIEEQIQFFPGDEVKIVDSTGELQAIWLGNEWESISPDESRIYRVWGQPGRSIVPRFKGTGMVTLEVSSTGRRNRSQ